MSIDEIAADVSHCVRVALFLGTLAWVAYLIARFHGVTL